MSFVVFKKELSHEPSENRAPRIWPRISTFTSGRPGNSDALNKNDAAAVAALFTEDGVYVTDTGPVNGRQAIEKYHADLFKQFHLSNNLVTVDADSPHIIGTAGNAMWATGAWSATIQGQNFGPQGLLVSDS